MREAAKQIIALFRHPQVMAEMDARDKDISA